MLIFGACLVCVYPTNMNSPATSTSTSRQKRVRTDPTAGTATIDLTTTASTPKTNRSPTKSDIQALDGATASLPTSLHPLVLHFGTKLISIRTKRITKENIAKRLTREPNYIPKSAKASDFKIALSKGASEDGKRVSFLEQQIQQAKKTYESSLKNVIEECITLETNALQSQENDIIYSLLPALAEAFNMLEGLNTNVHQKVITLLYLDSSFLSHSNSTSHETFIASYCAHHNLDTIPSPSIHPLTNTYTTAAQRDKEQLLHTKSLQLPENKGLQTFRKTVERIVTVPSVSFETQVDENSKEIILKKLSTEIIMGKTTEDTAMEMDAEGGASFEQLQDIIKKECDKRDKKYRSLEQKYNKIQDSFENSQPQKNLQTRGPRGASNKKKLPTVSRRLVPNQRGHPTTTKRQPHTARPRSIAGRQGKADDINKDTTNDNPIKSKGNSRSRSRQKKKPSTTDRTKSRLQSQAK